MRADIVGLSLQRAAGRGGLHAAGATTTPDAPDAAAARGGAGAAEALARERARRTSSGQHVKYDRHVFANHGIAVRGYAHDTHAAELRARGAQAAQPGEPGRAPPGRTGIDYEDVVRQGRAPDPVRAGRRSSKAAEYSCEDTDMTLRRAPGAVAAARGRRQAALRLRAIEMPTSAVLYRDRAQRRADRRARCWRAQSHELAERMHGAGAARPTSWPASRSTWAAPKQIGEILFGKLGLPVMQEDRRAARRAPTRRCWRSWPRTIRCRRKLLEHRGLSQAEGHLHRQAAADGEPAHRPRAHHTTRRRWR